MTSKVLVKASKGTQWRRSLSKTGIHLATVLRAWRFQVLSQFSKTENQNESKKTACHRSRKIAALHAIPHLIPLAAALALVALNLSHKFIGSASATGLTALQFTAKVQEIFTQASIAGILFAIVRPRLIGSQAFSFGGLIGPYRTTDVSYLWSLELWGALTTGGAYEWHSLLALLALPFGVLLAALVGPSSAILMIPRPTSYADSPVLLLFNDSAALYPQKVDLTDGRLVSESELNTSLSQATLGIEAYLALNLLPSAPTYMTIPIIDQSGIRILQSGSLGPAQIPGFKPGEESGHIITPDKSTVPTRLVSHILSAFYSFRANSIQPYALETCFQSFYHGERFVDFGPDKRYLNDLQIEWSSIYPNKTDDTMQIVELDDAGNPKSGAVGSYLSFHSVPTGITNTSALKIASTPGQQPGYLYGACSLHAYWKTAPTALDTTSIVSNQDAAIVLKDVGNDAAIALSPSWLCRVTKIAALAGSHVSETSTNPWIALALSAIPQLPVYDDWYYAFDPNYDPQGTDQSASPNEPALPPLTEEQQKAALQYFNDHKSLTTFDNIGLYASNLTTWTSLADLAELEVWNVHEDYGYNTSPVTVRLSLVVLLIYASVCTIYLSYGLITGSTATSWNTVAELATLALNSRRPEGLKNTSVGIDTMETFRQRVNVRVNDENSCELVFGDVKDGAGSYGTVAANEKY